MAGGCGGGGWRGRGGWRWCSYGPTWGQAGDKGEGMASTRGACCRGETEARSCFPQRQLQRLCSLTEADRRGGRGQQEVNPQNRALLRVLPTPLASPTAVGLRPGAGSRGLSAAFLSLPVFQRALAGNSSNSRLVGSLLGSDRRSAASAAPASPARGRGGGCRVPPLVPSPPPPTPWGPQLQGLSHCSAVGTKPMGPPGVTTS